MIRIDKSPIFKDAVLGIRARTSFNWWGLYLMKDLSLKIAHECDSTWQNVLPNKQCEKCNTSFDLDNSENGGFKASFLSSPMINDNILYHLSRQSLKQALKRHLKFNDPVIEAEAKTEIEDIHYSYRRYLAGFSIILHRRENTSSNHISSLFLNKGENNLVEIAQKECFLCKKECRGSEMRSFFILQSHLKT